MGRGCRGRGRPFHPVDRWTSSACRRVEQPHDAEDEPPVRHDGQRLIRVHKWELHKNKQADNSFTPGFAMSPKHTRPLETRHRNKRPTTNVHTAEDDKKMRDNKRPQRCSATITVRSTIVQGIQRAQGRATPGEPKRTGRADRTQSWVGRREEGMWGGGGENRGKRRRYLCVEEGGRGGGGGGGGGSTTKGKGPNTGPTTEKKSHKTRDTSTSEW